MRECILYLNKIGVTGKRFFKFKLTEIKWFRGLLQVLKCDMPIQMIRYCPRTRGCCWSYTVLAWFTKINTLISFKVAFIYWFFLWSRFSKENILDSFGNKQQLGRHSKAVKCTSNLSLFKIWFKEQLVEHWIL